MIASKKFIKSEKHKFNDEIFVNVWSNWFIIYFFITYIYWNILINFGCNSKLKDD